MKNLVVLLFSLMISIASFSQNSEQRNDLFKINDFSFGNAFEKADTVIAIGFSCDSFLIGITSSNMNYTMSFISKKGTLIYVKVVTYQDLYNAAQKAQVPISSIPAFLSSIHQTMVNGTLQNKVAVLNQILSSYGVIVKPSSEQNGIFNFN